jgi:hypothetical protein
MTTEPVPDADGVIHVDTDEPGLDPQVIEQLADDAPADVRTMRRLRSENARLRHKLRESEANRGSSDEATLARLAAMERQLVEHEVAEILADPADLWAHTDEETQQAWVDRQFGEVIPDAVRDSARAIVEARPHLARRATAPPTERPLEGLKSGAMPAGSQSKTPSWTAVIRGS